nr:unnamed protein product [Naegleria fowleri]
MAEGTPLISLKSLEEDEKVSSPSMYQELDLSRQNGKSKLTRRMVSPRTVEERQDLEKGFSNPVGGQGYHSNVSSSSDLSTLEKQPIYKVKGTKTQKLIFHICNISCPILILAFICIFGVGIALYFGMRVTKSSPPVQLVGKHAAVASDSSICSNMGLKVIKEKGGNAVDAAVVVALCLGVTRPFASGIGGGGFINIFLNQTKTIDFIDARETAASAASQDMYVNNNEESVTGGKAIAVYGEIKGLYMAHSAYGKLPWKDLFTDVIGMARNGWTVEPLLALRLSQDDILKYPTLKQFTTVDANGVLRVFKEGETIKRPEYANTLELIANQGPNVLYEGPIAEKIVEEIKQEGGIITLDDLKNYKPLRPFSDSNSIISLEEMMLDFEDYKVILPPPPSSGPVIRFILSILKNLNLSNTFQNAPIGLRYHYILEALKFGFGHRSILGDVNFLPKENVTKYIIDQLLSDTYAEQISTESVSPARTFPWLHYFPDSYAPIRDKGTSHFSIVDNEGNAVGMTTTVNHNFGSKVASLSTGVVFNNQMNDFTVDPNKPNQFGLPPSVANAIAPGKRPLSSMSPTIFLDKKDMTVKYVVGASGGPTIISAIIEVFFSIDKFGANPALAVELPRVHAQPGSSVVKIEEGFNKQVVSTLQEKGHVFEKVQILPDGHTIGCCQVVHVTKDEEGNRIILPATDPRKLGSPACY